MSVLTHCRRNAGAWLVPGPQLSSFFVGKEPTGVSIDLLSVFLLHFELKS
jgi:hypothetical protein